MEAKMGIIKEYLGPLHNPNDMELGPIKDAYVSYREQRTRCYNKNREKFKHYGAIGIEVKYTSRQFIAWWLENIKSFTGTKPTIGRKDHAGHYEFGNIIIQDRSENSIERNNRVPPHFKAKPITILNPKTNRLKKFKSRNEAARFLNIHPLAVKHV